MRKLSAEGYAPVVIGDLNDWDADVEDADGGASPLPSSRVFTALKDYQAGGGRELFNCLKFVKEIKERYTYDYKGSRTALDHILMPSGWEGDVASATIDHDTPSGASDHWPLVVRMGGN